MKIRVGDRVLYDGPHVEGYLPAIVPGIVEHTGPSKAQVRFPWGLHMILNSRLKPSESKPVWIPDAATVLALACATIMLDLI
jgi:hypothetical protein